MSGCTAGTLIFSDDWEGVAGPLTRWDTTSTSLVLAPGAGIGGSTAVYRPPGFTIGQCTLNKTVSDLSVAAGCVELRFKSDGGSYDSQLVGLANSPGTGWSISLVRRFGAADEAVRLSATGMTTFNAEGFFSSTAYQWIRLEWKSSTPIDGSTWVGNGYVRLYRDGVLMHEATGLQLHPVAGYAETFNQFQIRVQGWVDNAALRIGSAPINDECAGAIAITTLPYSTTQDVSAATVGTVAMGTCADIDDLAYTVWYTWTAPSNATVRLTLTDSQDWGGLWAIYTGSCGSLTQVACSDYADPGVNFTPVSGTTYYIQLATWDGTPTPESFTFQMRHLAPPAAPTLNAPTNITGYAALLTWSAPVGTNSYQLERCTGVSCSSFVLIASAWSAPAVTSYLDGGLTPLTAYSYRVRAISTIEGASAYSNIVSLTTTAAGTAPPAPEGLTTAFCEHFTAGTVATWENQSSWQSPPSARDGSYPYVSAASQAEIKAGIGPAGENAVGAQVGQNGNYLSHDNFGVWDATKGMMEVDFRAKTFPLPLPHNSNVSIFWPKSSPNAFGNGNIQPSFKPMTLSGTQMFGTWQVSTFANATRYFGGVLDIGTWWHYTLYWKCDSSGAYPYSGALDGFVRMTRQRSDGSGLVETVFEINNINLTINPGPTYVGGSGPPGFNTNEDCQVAPFMGEFTNICLSRWTTISVPEPPPEVILPPATGITWVELGPTHVWSKWDLPDRFDPVTKEYYHGYKNSRVISWGVIARALSGWDGQFEASGFSWTVSDSDRLLRRMLDAESTKYFRNRPIAVRMISDPQRRLEEKPRTVVRGYLTSYKATSPLQFEFTAVDLLTAKFASIGVDEAQVPKRRITAVDFPHSLDPGQLGMAIPIIYGAVSDRNILTSTVPGIPGGFLEWDKTIPTHDDGDEYPNLRMLGGFAPYDNTDSLGHTDAPSRAVWVYYIAVRAGKGNYMDCYGPRGPGMPVGTDGWNYPVDDPGHPLNYGIWMLWDNITGCDHVRVYIGDAGDYDPLLGKVGSCTQLKYMEFDNSTVDAHPIYDKDQGWGYWHEGINVLGGTTTPITTYTDLGKGAYKPMYMGVYDLTAQLQAAGYTFPPSTGAYHGWLVCGHAVKEIEDLYIGDQAIKIQSDPAQATAVGAPWLVPGYAEHDRVFGARYLLWNGQRWTMIFGRTDHIPANLAAGSEIKAVEGEPEPPKLPDDTEPFMINVKGIETVGDGTGTFLTDIFQQYKHFVINWVIHDYRDGPWLEAPPYEDDPTLKQVNTESFDICSSIAATRIAGGYVGAGVIGADGEVLSVRDAIARWNLSGDCDSGFDRFTRFFISMVNDTGLETPVEITDVNDVIQDTLDIDDNVSQHANIVPINYRRDYSGREEWGVQAEASDPVSIQNYTSGQISGAFRAADVDLWLIRDDAIAMSIAKSRLARQTYPPRLVRFAAPINLGANLDLGDVVALTHFGGIGPDGYVRRAMRIVRHDLDPENFVVQLECYDLGDVFAERRLILGDTTALPSSWGAADADERAYGYLADSGTRQFSDGKLGKKL